MSGEPPSTRPVAKPAPTDDSRSVEQRYREGAGPDDHGFYTCVCGYAFDAHVSTSVCCPHCGDQQAW